MPGVQDAKLYFVRKWFSMNDKADGSRIICTAGALHIPIASLSLRPLITVMFYENYSECRRGLC